MVDAALVEVLAEVLCATSAVLFTFIAVYIFVVAVIFANAGV